MRRKLHPFVLSVCTLALLGAPCAAQPARWTRAQGRAWGKALWGQVGGDRPRLRPSSYAPGGRPGIQAYGHLDRYLAPKLSGGALPGAQPVARGGRADFPNMRVQRLTFPSSKQAFAHGSQMMTLLADPDRAKAVAQRYPTQPVVVDVKGKEVVLLEGDPLGKSPGTAKKIRDAAWGEQGKLPSSALGVFDAAGKDGRRGYAIDLAQKGGPAYAMLKPTHAAGKQAEQESPNFARLAPKAFFDRGSQGEVLSLLESPQGGVSLLSAPSEKIASRVHDLAKALGGQQPRAVDTKEGKPVIAVPGRDGRPQLRLGSILGPLIDLAKKVIRKLLGSDDPNKDEAKDDEAGAKDEEPGKDKQKGASGRLNEVMGDEDEPGADPGEPEITPPGDAPAAPGAPGAPGDGTAGPGGEPCPDGSCPGGGGGGPSGGGGGPSGGGGGGPSGGGGPGGGMLQDLLQNGLSSLGGGKNPGGDPGNGVPQGTGGQGGDRDTGKPPAGEAMLSETARKLIDLGAKKAGERYGSTGFDLGPVERAHAAVRQSPTVKAGQAFWKAYNDLLRAHDDYDAKGKNDVALAAKRQAAISLGAKALDLLTEIKDAEAFAASSETYKDEFLAKAERARKKLHAVMKTYDERYKDLHVVVQKLSKDESEEIILGGKGLEGAMMAAYAQRKLFDSDTDPTETKPGQKPRIRFLEPDAETARAVRLAIRAKAEDSKK